MALVNRLIALIAATDGFDYVLRKTLLDRPEKVLLNLYPPLPDGSTKRLSRPETPLSISSLLTGSRHDPPLEHELRQEMLSADRVDILVSFVKWSGLRLLQPAFEALAERQVPVRLVTTSYMGASDPEAIAWLAAQHGVSVIASLHRYQPNLKQVRAVGFCASVKHANFMAAAFNEQGLTSAVIVAETPSEVRAQRVQDFRNGRLPFVFTVDVFSEGVDVPEINLVMFLRPTESLTVFLQQLGRGLRNYPGKDCLTVLDFIGQSNRRYRIDRKYAALMTSDRQRIDREVEGDFPHLPPGCNIQLERIARENILNNIRETLKNLDTLVVESLATFERDHNCKPTFANFVRSTCLSPLALLKNKTWSEWLRPLPIDQVCFSTTVAI